MAFPHAVVGFTCIGPFARGRPVRDRHVAITHRTLRDTRRGVGRRRDVRDLALSPAERLAECRALLVAAQHEQLRALRQQGV
jgi:hypothetical protein